MRSDAEKWVESGQKRVESTQKLQEESTRCLTSYCTCIQVTYLLFIRAALHKLLTSFSLYVALNDLDTVSTVRHASNSTA